MRILPLLVLIPFCFIGCGSDTPAPKQQAADKPAPVSKKKDHPRTDHILDDVKDAPTYGDGMLRTLNGAKDVKKQIDKQTAEQKDEEKSADSNTDEH